MPYSVHMWILHAYVRTYVFMYVYVIATPRFECAHTYIYECVYTRCMYDVCVCMYVLYDVHIIMCDNVSQFTHNGVVVDANYAHI